MKLPSLTVLVAGGIMTLGLVMSYGNCNWYYNKIACHINMPAATACGDSPIQCGVFYKCSPGSNIQYSYPCYFSEGNGGLFYCMNKPTPWVCTLYSYPSTHCLFSGTCGTAVPVSASAGNCQMQYYSYC
jgi:hypothetical protein